MHSEPECAEAIDAANALMPAYIAGYNRRLGELLRDRDDPRRLRRADGDLGLIFAWR
jgi:hypothetical protein